MNHLKVTYHSVKLFFHFLMESYVFLKLTLKYNASINTDSDIEKMQYTLLRENHTIEKGMSMRNPKKGFGQQKVINLIKRLDRYADLYLSHDAEFITYPLSTIKNYIKYTKDSGVNIGHIEESYRALLEKVGFDDVEGHAGICKETRNHILEECKKDFKSLLYSRHSIRYFSEKIPDIEIIEKALQIAQQTPSACNRQGWKTHVFFNEDSIKLIKWQGGCRGFEEEIRCSILVTANLKAFLSYEVHQAYVDGGLFAMNLINALHYLGLGTIPLSTAFRCKKLRRLNMFGIHECEIPILIIGVGNLMEVFNIAASTRKKIIQTNTFHFNENINCKSAD